MHTMHTTQLTIWKGRYGGYGVKWALEGIARESGVRKTGIFA